MLWSRKWPPTPVFLPGKSHGQRGLVGYSPWACKESDMTEQSTHVIHNILHILYIYTQPYISYLKLMYLIHRIKAHSGAAPTVTYHS